MAGSVLGEVFKDFHMGRVLGAGVGVVVDGCPAGIDLCEEDIQRCLNRRKPGETRYSTPRKEGDVVRIMSGVFEGKTTGTPISLVVENTSQRSADYSEIANYYRPGHADYTFDAKYGFRDYRGGGRSSGRETIGRVAAGAIALKILERLGIQVTAYTSQIGPYQCRKEYLQYENIEKSPLRMPGSTGVGTGRGISGRQNAGNGFFRRDDRVRCVRDAGWRGRTGIWQTGRLSGVGCFFYWCRKRRGDWCRFFGGG